MNAHDEWLTVHDAARILRVSTRQTHRYAEEGRIVTRRAGRRVLFSRASVVQLADDLAVDIRPQSQSRDVIPPDLVRAMTEQAQAVQRQANQGQRIEERLDDIDRRLAQPAQLTIPRWLAVVAALALMLLFAIFMLLVLRS